MGTTLKLECCCRYSIGILQQPQLCRTHSSVVPREVFLVPEDMLVSARVLSPVPCCQLRVFNNDTGEELPRIVGKVVPSVYQPNKVGGKTTPKHLRFVTCLTIFFSHLLLFLHKSQLTSND